MSCPIKTSNEYKTLYKLVGGNEDEVMRVFMAHGENIPQFENISTVKKTIGFKKSGISGLQRGLMLKRLGLYNKAHNTSHRIVFLPETETSDSAVLKVNLMPKYNGYENNDINTKDINIVDPETIVEITLSPSDAIFMKSDSEFIVGGEIYPTYEDAERSLFQISSGNTAPNADLDKFLASFMGKYGITVQTINNFRQRFGVDGVAVADMAHKMILVAEGKASLDTLPEEAAHFIIEMLGEDSALYKALEANITSTQIYKDVVAEYNEVYKGDERLLRKEAMGKLLAQHIITKHSEIVSDKTMSILDRVVKWFKNVFAKFNSNALENKIAEAYSKVADTIFDGTINIDIDNIRDPLTLYSLSEYKQVLKNSTKLLREHVKALAARSTGEESQGDINNLKLVVATINDYIENNNVAEAVAGFVEHMMSYEFPSMVETMLAYQKGDVELPSAKDINYMRNTVNMYSAVVSDILKAKQYVDEDLSELITPVTESLDSLNSIIVDLLNFIDVVEKKRLRMILADNPISYDGKTVDADELINSKMGDVNFMGKYITPLYAVDDDTLRMVYKIVNDIKNEAYRNAISIGNKLNVAREAMEKAGFKDMEIFYEKFSDGSLTGFLVSEFNWGEYNKALDEVRTAIAKIAEVDSYDKVNDEDLTTEQRAKKKALWKAFAAKYRTRDGEPKPPRNPAYEKMLKMHPTVSEFYKLIRDHNNRTKEKLPAKYSRPERKLLLPQVRMDVMQTIKNSDDKLSKIVKTNIVESLVRTEQDIEFGDTSGDVIINIQGKAVSKLPIHFSSPLKDMNRLSRDIVSMYAHYTEMAYNFKGLNDRIDEIELIQKAVADRSVTDKKTGRFSKKGIESNAYHALEAFLKQNVYDFQKNAITVPSFTKKGERIDISKVVYGLVEYIRAKNLFLNLPTILSGRIKSGIDSVIENVIGEFVTFDSKAFAKTETMKQLPFMMRDFGQRVNRSKLNLMLQFNGISSGLESTFKRLDLDNPLMRVTGQDVLYGSYEMMEKSVNTQLLIALYDNFRLVDGKFMTFKEYLRFKTGFDTKGKYLEKNPGDTAGYDKLVKEVEATWKSLRDKSLYNAYQANNGTLEVKPEFEKYVTKQLINRVQAVLQNRVHVISGTLGKRDKGQINTNVMGQLVMMHRGWIVTGAVERWKGRGINPITELEEEGFHLTASKVIGRFLIDMFTDRTRSIKQKLAVWNTLEPWQQNNVKRAMIDLAFTALVFVVYKLAHALGDDDEEDAWTLRFAQYLSTRAFLEQAAFSNPVEIMSILNSPSAANSTAEQFTNLFMAFFNDEEIKYGAFEGMSHKEKALLQLSLLKNMVEIQNPEQKDKYIMNMIVF